MTTNVPTLPKKVVSLARALEESELPYAFGGALALAYYAEPRATVDIDVNVFVSPQAFRTVVKALEPLGVEATDADRRSALRDGQVRLWWGNTPVDLFFANGHVMDDIEKYSDVVTWAQPNQLFRNRGPSLAGIHFEDVSAATGVSVRVAPIFSPTGGTRRS